MRRFEFTPVAEAVPDHPLAAVDGVEVSGGGLRVLIGPKIIGSRHFRLLLEKDGRSRPFVQGLYASGRYPGQNWVEIYDVDLPPGLGDAGEWAVKLASYLGPVTDTIPPGGHVSIEYEKALWRETQLGLLAGIPPIATPMGALLFELGAAGTIKDWYFPEGGAEGGRKLQGNKPLSPEHAAETAAARAAELRAFLEMPAQGQPEHWARARDRAETVLRALAG